MRSPAALHYARTQAELSSTNAPVPREPQADNPPDPVAHVSIAARAYELWQARGCPAGSSEVDWFQAEQELRSRADQQRRAPGSQAGVGATEDQVNMPATLPERVDKHGSKVEDVAGTGEHDSLGG